MAEFFAVFNVQEALAPTGEITDSVDKNSDTVKLAKVVKVTGTAVADVQAYVRTKFAPISGTPVVVTEAQWKTS